jgi:hypothetical protein
LTRIWRPTIEHATREGKIATIPAPRISDLGLGDRQHVEGSFQIISTPSLASILAAKQLRLSTGHDTNYFAQAVNFSHKKEAAIEQPLVCHARM